MACTISSAAVLAFVSPQFAADWPSARIQEAANRVLCELENLGYSIPTKASPVRINVLNQAPSAQAGGWLPGSVSLRGNLREGLQLEKFLRHELMHEASFRTCAGRLPQWVEEAKALTFSGELSAVEQAQESVDITELQESITDGRTLGPSALVQLREWASRNPVPLAPCVIPSPPSSASKEPGILEYRLIHFYSARILDRAGNQDDRSPPGSLLKLLWASCASSETPLSAAAIGRALAASDAKTLLDQAFKVDRHCLTSLDRTTGIQFDSSTSDSDWMGFRNPKGEFSITGSLTQLVQAMRWALWSLPPQTRENMSDFTGAATLTKASRKTRATLHALHALAKTGTVADSKGNPLWGYFLVAWPHQDPKMLGIVRQQGVNGFTAAEHALPIVERWAKISSENSAITAVQLASRTPRAQISFQAPCGVPRVVGERRVSGCGIFDVESWKRGFKLRRHVRGILRDNSRGLFLETDAATYSEGVLEGEAAHLRGEARRALRAVIQWNALHHQGPLCDNTRCMVLQSYKGDDASDVETALIRQLSERTPMKKRWLPFSLGGAESWERTFSTEALSARLGLENIIDLRRGEHEGSVSLEVDGVDQSHRILCEQFRNQLNLLSCPDTVRYIASQKEWRFTGRGEGHGDGMSIRAAEEMAGQGQDARKILRFFYP